MSQYELTFLFDKSKKTFPATLKSYLKNAAAIKVVEDDWGVKPLAYPIRKSNEAHYVHFTAGISKKKIGNLEKKLLLDEDIWRYLVVKIEEKVKKGKVDSKKKSK